MGKKLIEVLQEQNDAFCEVNCLLNEALIQIGDNLIPSRVVLIAKTRIKEAMVWLSKDHSEIIILLEDPEMKAGKEPDADALKSVPTGQCRLDNADQAMLTKDN